MKTYKKSFLIVPTNHNQNQDFNQNHGDNNAIYEEGVTNSISELQHSELDISAELKCYEFLQSKVSELLFISD